MMDTALLKPLAEDEPASATSLKRKASAEPNSPRPESLKRARRDSSPEPPQAAAPVSDGDDQSNVMEDEPSGDAKPGAPATAVVQKQEPSSEPAHSVDAYSNTAEEKPQGDTATAPYSPSRRSTSPSRDRDQDRPRQDSNAARERKERFEKEEKKRGQRLFGNILGTLSRRDTSETHKKRLEIDRRQQERLRQQREEADRARAEKKAKLREVRLREQIVWEEEVMRAKHASWREGAGFLRTRTSPGIVSCEWSLFYMTRRKFKLDSNFVLSTINHGPLRKSKKKTFCGRRMMLSWISNGTWKNSRRVGRIISRNTGRRHFRNT